MAKKGEKAEHVHWRGDPIVPPPVEPSTDKPPQKAFMPVRTAVNIMLHANGGCRTCVTELCYQLSNSIPNGRHEVNFALKSLGFETNKIRRSLKVLWGPHFHEMDDDFLTNAEREERAAQKALDTKPST